MKIKNRKLHKDDKNIIIKFIDYVRLEKSFPCNYRLELDVRRVSRYMNIKENVKNSILANRFANLLESKTIN